VIGQQDAQRMEHAAAHNVNAMGMAMGLTAMR
jgi:hypothetical protein